MVMEIVLLIVGFFVAANVLMAGSIRHQDEARFKTPPGPILKGVKAACGLMLLATPFLIGLWTEFM